MSTTVVDAAFRSRLTQVIQSFGSVVALATAVGVSDNAIYKWLAGRGQPSVANLVALARAARVSVEWLATGAEAAQGAQAASRAVEHGDFIFMPRNRIRFSSGRDGILRSEQVVDSIAFRADWVKRVLHTEPRFRQDGIYLLRHDGGLEVKRIQRRPDGKMLVRSDNPKYESMIVPTVKIIGRVIWIGGSV